MGLNIKNERTHALVRELAELTGMSQTSAVEDAVRRRLVELEGEAPQRQRAGRPPAKFSVEEAERRLATIQRVLGELHAETAPEQWEALDRARDELYDDLGLPA